MATYDVTSIGEKERSISVEFRESELHETRRL